MNQRIGVGTLVAFVLALVVVGAQAPALKRTNLQQVDLAAAGFQGIQVMVEMPPQGTSGRHTHPGDEISVVLSGEFELEVAGQPTRTFKAGEAFHVPANTIHNATNRSGAATTLLVSYVVEKDKPVSTPVN